MKRAILITVLAVIAFAAILIARLPASWVVPSSPAKMACAATDGTLWSGSCTGLVVQNQAVGDLTWEIHAARLLAGKIAAHITIARPGSGNAETSLESSFSGKRVSLSDLKADFQPDPAMLQALQSNMHGVVHLDLKHVELDNDAVLDLQGHIDARDLSQTGGTPGSLGSYAVDFPGGSHPPQGRLRDLGGPMAVEGEVTLKGPRSVEVSGLVAARESADPSLVSQLRILGTPDAQGRRPFSLEYSF
jgi:general secretion pathway protein N